MVVARRVRNGGDGVEPHLPARALAARRYGWVDSRRGRRSNRLRRRPGACDPPLRRGFWTWLAHTLVRTAMIAITRRQLPPRLLQESVFLNAEESEPPASFKVLIADLVSFARLCT